MIKVLCSEYYDNTLVIIEGHAGFAACGEDIVCSAVSALVFTLINCLEEEEGSDRITLRRKIIRDGYVCLEAEHRSYAKSRTEAIIETCIKGLSMLSDTYPDYIKFEM